MEGESMQQTWTRTLSSAGLLVSIALSGIAFGANPEPKPPPPSKVNTSNELWTNNPSPKPSPAPAPPESTTGQQGGKNQNDTGMKPEPTIPEVPKVPKK